MITEIVTEMVCDFLEWCTTIFRRRRGQKPGRHRPKKPKETQ